MATERTSPPLAEYFKFQQIGQRVVGLVEKFFSNENGISMILSPVIIWTKKGDRPSTYANIAIGLTTDLKYKIAHYEQADRGKWFSIELTNLEHTNKGAPRKIFQVLELEPAEVGNLAEQANGSHRSDPFKNMENGDDDFLIEEGKETLPF